jgi:hypothetical protein
MPKEYFCKKFNDFIQCCETDPLKFEKGRYSLCKKCRIASSTEQKRKKKQEIEKNELYDTVKEVINNENLIDGKSIIDTLTESVKIVSEVSYNSYFYKTKREDVNNNFTYLFEQQNKTNILLENIIENNKNLEKRIKFLEADVKDLIEENKLLKDKLEKNIFD